MEHVFHVVWGVANGRLSLHFIIVSSLILLVVTLLLSAYLIVFYGCQQLRLRYRRARSALYAPAIEQVLMEEPLDAVVATLRPRRWGDLEIVQDVMTDSMRHLEGAPFETLRQAADRLGLIEKNVAQMRSPQRHRRGRAMDALGIMRSTRAVPSLLASLSRETLDLKLVALRALAAIGDPSVLPAFLAESDRLPPTLLPRLVSMILEFGADGRRTATEILNRHARSFTPAVMRDILMELAAHSEDVR